MHGRRRILGSLQACLRAEAACLRAEAACTAHSPAASRAVEAPQYQKLDCAHQLSCADHWLRVACDWNQHGFIFTRCSGRYILELLSRERGRGGPLPAEEYSAKDLHARDKGTKGKRHP